MRFNQLHRFVALWAAGMVWTATAVAEPPDSPQPPEQPQTKGISLSIAGEGMPSLLGRLAEATGERFTAVGHLADQQVTIYCEGADLEQVQRALAAVFSTKVYPAFWIADGDAPRRHELFQDARVASGAVRRAVFLRDRRIIGASLSRLIAFASSGAQAKPESIQGDTVSAALTSGSNWKHGVRAQLLTLGSLAEADHVEVLSGAEVWRPFSDLPAGAQDAIVADLATVVRRGRRGPTGGVVLESTPEAIARVRRSDIGLQIKLNDQGSRWELAIEIRDTDGWTGFAAFPLGDVNVGNQPVVPDFSAPPPSLADRPIDLDVVNADQPWAEFAEFQRFIANVLNTPMVSDYFHDVRAPTPRILSESRSVRELLDAACRRARYSWSFADGVLIFRRETWYLDELNEPPARLVRRLVASMSERGFLDLDDLSAAAAMTAQATHTLTKHDARFRGMEALGSVRPALLWYGALPPAVQTAARSPGGIFLADSPRAALEALFSAAKSKRTVFGSLDEPAGLRLSVRQEQTGSEVITIIDAIPSAGGVVRNQLVQRRVDDSAQR